MLAVVRIVRSVASRASRGGSRRRAPALPALLLLLAASACGDGPAGVVPAGVVPGVPARVSLLAVGDTGEAPGWLREPHGEGEVAAAIVASHRAAPADALVLLGDNFYPDGLSASDLESRVCANLLRPYGAFVALTARGRRRLGPRCSARGAPARSAVPILAVLGNHDYHRPESPWVEAERLPAYVGNWWMPHAGRVAGVFELSGGVSVVALQSPELLDGATSAPLVAALRRARGPWRVLIAHHPIADPGDGYSARYARAVQRAVAASGRTVQLALAGHAHNLQALAPEGGRGRPLVLVAGGGFEARPVADPAPDRLRGVAARGFARLDLVRTEVGERLQATLVAVGSGPATGSRTRPLASYSVAPDGSFRTLPPAEAVRLAPRGEPIRVEPPGAYAGAPGASAATPSSSAAGAT